LTRALASRRDPERGRKRAPRGKQLRAAEQAITTARRTELRGTISQPAVANDGPIDGPSITPMKCNRRSHSAVPYAVSRAAVSLSAEPTRFSVGGMIALPLLFIVKEGNRAAEVRREKARAPLHLRSGPQRKRDARKINGWPSLEVIALTRTEAANIGVLGATAKLAGRALPRVPGEIGSTATGYYVTWLINMRFRSDEGATSSEEGAGIGLQYSSTRTGWAWVSRGARFSPRFVHRRILIAVFKRAFLQIQNHRNNEKPSGFGGLGCRSGACRR